MNKLPKPTLDLTASCDCGAVELHAKGQPISMFQCACLNCQKATGSGHSSIVLFRLTDVNVAGTTKTFVRPADSGAVFTRHFCPDCATTIFAASSRAPDFAIVPAGLFAGQNDWYHPNQLIFARAHAEWDLIADHLPRHERYRESRP